MTEESILQIISSYLIKHKYTPERINTSKLPPGKKAPDFLVKANKILKFYCEIKTPDLKLNPKTNLFNWQTTVSKLRDLIHKAAKQFKDEDSLHSIPWVVIFTSCHMQLNWTNLSHCIQGKVGYGKDIIKDLTDQRYIKDTNQDVKNIDLFIWSQVNEQHKKIYQMVHFINHDSKLLSETTEISNKLIPYANEDIMDRSSRKYQ